jgi:HK97 family phage prohead protease
MQIEIRADNTALITGYVNVAGRESRVLRDASGPFVEVVQPGTFQRALEKNPVGLMFNHRQALGSTEDVLELKEDNIGLYARALVHDSDIVEKAKAGQLTGWSFGFFVDKDEWKTKEDGMRLRTLEDIDLAEVSILDMTPAYIATSIEMRGEQESLKEFRNINEPVNVIQLEERTEPAPEDPEKEKKEDVVDMADLKRQLEFIKLK